VPDGHDQLLPIARPAGNDTVRLGPEGLILFNTGTPKSGPIIVESIKKLGFIKIIINGHAHSDHFGAGAYMKDLSKAQVAIMEGDVAMVEDGGKSDFHYGRDWQVMGQPPVKVDRVLRDGDTVTLGDVVLTAYNTPGHTRGATTWVTTLVDGRKAYKVVFPDGAGANPISGPHPIASTSTWRGRGRVPRPRG
jgi:metallo-beta-lactamase class B